MLEVAISEAWQGLRRLVYVHRSIVRYLYAYVVDPECAWAVKSGSHDDRFRVAPKRARRIMLGPITSSFASRQADTHRWPGAARLRVLIANYANSVSRPAFVGGLDFHVERSHHRSVVERFRGYQLAQANSA